MRITLELPDNTVSIKYCVDDGGTYPSDDKPVTLGMIITVGTGNNDLLDRLNTISSTPYTNKTTDSTKVSL